MRSTLSYSGHMLVQVPTGVMAWLRYVGWLGSAIRPSFIAFSLSSTLPFLSCIYCQKPIHYYSDSRKFPSWRATYLLISLIVSVQSRSVLHRYRIPIYTVGRPCSCCLGSPFGSLIRICRHRVEIGWLPECATFLTSSLSTEQRRKLSAPSQRGKGGNMHRLF